MCHTLKCSLSICTFWHSYKCSVYIDIPRNVQSNLECFLSLFLSFDMWILYLVQRLLYMLLHVRLCARGSLPWSKLTKHSFNSLWVAEVLPAVEMNRSHISFQASPLVNSIVSSQQHSTASLWAYTIKYCFGKLVVNALREDEACQPNVAAKYLRSLDGEWRYYGHVVEDPLKLTIERTILRASNV